LANVNRSLLPVCGHGQRHFSKRALTVEFRLTGRSAHGAERRIYPAAPSPTEVSIPEGEWTRRIYLTERRTAKALPIEVSVPR
jgi:hypothetical protein